MSSTQTNEIKTGFLDYAGLSKFWELVRAKVAAELSVATGDNGVEIKLKDVNGTSLGEGGTIPLASSSSAGLMSSAQVNKLESIAGDIASAITLDGIKVNNNEAKIANKKINIDFTYDKNSQSIKIVDLNDNNKVLTSISATDFIANGIFNKADFVEKQVNGESKIYLQLTFTMPDETENTIEIQVTDLITKYEAGNGISILNESVTIGDELINSGTIALNIKDTEKYIKCDSNGVYTDGIDTAIATAKSEALTEALNADKTAEDIQIAGGPLANDIAEKNEAWPWTDAAGNNVIPKGKSLEEILSALFLKVINGTVTKSNPVWNPTLNDPSVSLVSSTNTNTEVSGIVEVGTKVAAKIVTSNTVTGNTRTQDFTCSQGHFIGTGTTWNTGNYRASKAGSIGTISSTNKASVSSMKWNNTVVTAPANGTTTVNNIDTVLVKDLTVAEGTNTFAATQNGLTASVGKFDNAGTNIYASTNTKVKLDAHQVIDTTDPDDIALSSDSSATITGKRYMFCGTLREAPQSLTSDIIRNTQYGKAMVAGTVEPNDNNEFYISLPTAGNGVKYFYIAIPNGSNEDPKRPNLTLDLVYNSGVGEGIGNIDAFLFTNNIKTVAVSGANNYASVNYTVYTYTASVFQESNNNEKLLIRIKEQTN